MQIQASDLEKGHAQVIEDNINAKYANKVIQKIGLCICMYDLLSASDGLIGNGDGLVNVNGVYYVLYLSDVEGGADYLVVGMNCIHPENSQEKDISNIRIKC